MNRITQWAGFGLLACLAGAASLAQTITTVNFPTNGDYYISIPSSPRPSVTNAEQLLDFGSFTSVARFRKDNDQFYTWNGASCLPSVDPASVGAGAPCSTQCFCVIPGEGFKVSVLGAPRTWNVTGYDGITVYPLTAPSPGVSLDGTNLMALPIAPVAGFSTALDLMNDINTKAAGGMVQSVARYITSSGTFQVYTGMKNSPSPNFNLVTGESYLVKVNTGAGTLSYTPPQPGQIWQNPCIQTSVAGTAPMPPGFCGYVSPAAIHLLVNGLPAGTELKLNATHRRFFNVTPFTSLQPSVTTENFDSDLVMNLTGTGILSAVNCSVTMTPVHAVIDANPTQVGAPIQDFNANMRSLTGTLTNDTTCNLFGNLTIEAGTDHGLPSPGHVHLVQRPDGSFDVNSYFDVNVKMSFVGKAGSILDGMSGTTTQTVRMGTPTNVPTAPTATSVPALSGSGMTVLAVLLMSASTLWLLRRASS